MAESSPGPTENRERERAIARELLPFVAGLLFTLPLAADWVADLVGWRVFFLSDARIQFVWTALVQAAVIAPLYLRAGGGLRRGQALVVLAAAALFLFSTYRTFIVPTAGGRTWYDVSAALVVLTLFWRLVGVLSQKSDRPWG